MKMWQKVIVGAIVITVLVAIFTSPADAGNTWQDIINGIVAFFGAMGV